MKTVFELVLNKFHDKMEYQLNGKSHREEEDGPTLIDDDMIYYHLNGYLHRVAGPALIRYTNNTRYIREAWALHGRRHREEGPAVVLEHAIEYWFQGKEIICSSTEEFKRIIKLLYLQ